jgi:hypothetical protein
MLTLATSRWTVSREVANRNRYSATPTTTKIPTVIVRDRWNASGSPV